MPARVLPNVLELKDAAFRLGDRIIFENTTWTIGPGEAWAVLGRNGSGKSLLVEALQGCLPLVRGEMLWPMEDTAEDATAGIGTVSFAARHLTVAETVVQSRWNSLEAESTMLVRDFLSYETVMEVNPFEITARHQAARPAFARKIRRASKELHIGPLLDRPLLALSNGERQRVQIAREWSKASTLLILDEPFQGLDRASREQTRHIVSRIIASGLPVLILTTREEELPDAITHALRIEKGYIVDSGRRADVVRRAAKPNTLPAHGTRTNRSAAHSSFKPSHKSTAGKPLVEFRGVAVQYDHHRILRCVDWTIREGESWALLGANGSGKSTLLSIILGDHPQAWSNDVRILGRQFGSGLSIWELKTHIGFVSPELQVHFPPDATGLEVVGSGFFNSAGLFVPLSRPQTRAAMRQLTKAGLAFAARIPFGSLSDGEQRLLLLARALVRRPRLLLLDEPSQGLDLQARAKVNRTIEDILQRSVVTAVYVTHREEEIPSSIRKILRLAGGNAIVSHR